jgi:hypothetical protein
VVAFPIVGAAASAEPTDAAVGDPAIQRFARRLGGQVSPCARDNVAGMENKATRQIASCLQALPGEHCAGGGPAILLPEPFPETIQPCVQGKAW